MKSEEFVIPTEDGVTHLHGVVMQPDQLQPLAGALLMVPGGWFSERDGFFGDTYTEDDLLFLRIARRMVSEGFVVVRYDNRGVSGNELTIGLTKESSDPLADTKRYLETCVDSEVRKSVTPETLAADATAVYQFTTQLANVNSTNIVIFAHSEGALHVSRLIGDQHIAPRGILLAGATTQSPMEVMRWQSVERYVDEVMRWDRDDDGRVSLEDVQAAFEDSYFLEVGISEEELQPTTGHWTRKDLLAHFASKYEQERDKVLGCPDDLPFPRPGEGHLDYVAASHRWLKQFYLDDTPVLTRLRSYPGQVAFHFGEIDRQLPLDREIANLQAEATPMASEPGVVVHPARGHAFGPQPVAGPMAQDAEDRFTEALTAMLTAVQKCIG